MESILASKYGCILPYPLSVVVSNKDRTRDFSPKLWTQFCLKNIGFSKFSSIIINYYYYYYYPTAGKRYSKIRHLL